VLNHNRHRAHYTNCTEPVSDIDQQQEVEEIQIEPLWKMQQAKRSKSEGIDVDSVNGSVDGMTEY